MSDASEESALREGLRWGGQRRSGAGRAAVRGSCSDPGLGGSVPCPSRYLDGCTERDSGNDQHTRV